MTPPLTDGEIAEIEAAFRLIKGSLHDAAAADWAMRYGARLIAALREAREREKALRDIGDRLRDFAAGLRTINSNAYLQAGLDKMADDLDRAALPTSTGAQP